MKSYGRAPTFLLATGYEQVRSVVAALVGDRESARDLHLSLPETGVCSTDLAGDGASCCGTASVQPALLAVSDIPVSRRQLQAISLQVGARVCGCDDSCCSDGARSVSCGCDTACCS
jgi:hypothetical protein